MSQTRGIAESLPATTEVASDYWHSGAVQTFPQPDRADEGTTLWHMRRSAQDGPRLALRGRVNHFVIDFTWSLRS
jgi:hypothetical protein